MSETVLLTGATGFVGTWIAAEFLTTTDARLVALVRAPTAEAAAHRLRRAWWDHPDLARALGERVQVIAGDITRPGLGLDPAALDELAGTASCIVHAAADLRLRGPLEEMRRTNVGGTENVLDLARAAHRDHGLGRFVHISTAYVAGDRQGDIREEELIPPARFAGTYEQTKYEGETLVRKAMGELPVTILRPGMVVGDSRTGAIHTFNTLYYLVWLYLGKPLWLLPVRPSLRVNMVPVDWVARTAVSLARDPRAAGLTFHLTAPPDALPTAGEMAAFVHGWARQHLDARLPRPVLLPPPPLLTRLAAKVLDENLSDLVPYLNERRVFCRHNLNRLQGPYRLDWREYLPNLLAYAVRYGFMHRRGRTVHEQLFFRLGSRSHPPAYCDLAEGRLTWRTAADLRRDVVQAAAALRAADIGRGDRVGIVGFNSTRYTALDTALGLIGAVSVPIYYTSPPGEIRAILADSGAKMLLVGAPALLPGLADLAHSMPVVSFCRQALPAGIDPSVVAWEKFLSRGHPGAEFSPAPVGPDDLATIRYTSGTTGRPSGVAFTHRQLRWMAETVASLMPWRVRTRPVRYLSFLPQSHVVEGILGAYTPYFARIRLTIFFLEEFGALPQALRQARPTFFFCVPRFYEKLWEKASVLRLAQRWREAPQSPVGRLLRPLLRHGLLRRAGLDRCGYLVVGSAPVHEELLNTLAGLGIPVHNAYGLTEAPLVTINRPGRMLRGSVGQPLPETELRLADDGEVLVRGPQVAAGCCGPSGIAWRRPEEWLCTGDYGQLTEGGGLVITGRKKDVIVTAYGKNVSPLKAESEYRRLPGILEAVLVGEGRPYCAALLWVDPARAGSLKWDELDRMVAAANRCLAHPEQAKRWAVLPYDLSVANGDLTANLKLRRGAIASRVADVVEALYGAAKMPQRVLHVGSAQL